MPGLRLSPLVLLASATMVCAAPSLVVDWGGDYVSASVVHGNTSISGWQVATAGTQGYASRLLDLAPGSELTPASGYLPPAGKTGAFYGGYSGALAASPAVPGGEDGMTAGYRVVENHGSSDWIVVQRGGNPAKIRGAVVFQKHDFLNGSAGRTITLGATSLLTFSGMLDGWRPEARWLVRDGATWYISEATLAPQSEYNVPETRTLAPRGTKWAVFHPTSAGIGGSYFSAATGPFQKRVFQDVTAVGVYFDSFNAVDALGGTSLSRFALAQFQVRADTAEPTVVADWGGNSVSDRLPHANAVYDGTSGDDWEISTAGTQGFATRLFDTGTARSLAPGSGYTAPPGKISAFYGGYSAALNAGPAVPGGENGVTAGYRVVEQNGSADRIVLQGSGNVSQIRGAIVFTKEDFGGQSRHSTISLDSASRLIFSGILDGWRPVGRWLIREGGAWFISEATLAPQSAYNVAESRTLDPHETAWAPFQPTTAGTGGSYFSPAPTSFSAKAFSNVTGAGVFFDSFGATTSLGGTSFSRFALESFQLKARVQEPPVTILSTHVINDTIPDEVFPTSLAKASNGDLLLAFSDKGDVVPGTKGFLIRSTDQGATWSDPIHIFQSSDPTVGTTPTIAALPDGSLLLTLIDCVHPAYPSHSHRYMRISTWRSVDDGASFQPLAWLPVPLRSISGVMGTVCQLPNGDLILPAFTHQGEYAREIGYNYGSGFFRSTDGGISWDLLEIAFKDPPPGVPTALSFTESAFVVAGDDDTNPLNDPIIALARIDTDPSGQYSGGVSNSLWRTVSTDNGQTWSDPEPMGISGIYPAVVRAGPSAYLMVCGDREAPVSRQVSFFTSHDAQNYVLRERAPAPFNTATGGGQAIVELSPGLFYVAYYTSRQTPDPHDPPGNYQVYLAGSTVRIGDPSVPWELPSSEPGGPGVPPAYVPAKLTSAVSEKHHGDAGAFSISLTPGADGAASGVECRSGDTLTIIAHFDRAIEDIEAAVASGAARLVGKPACAGNSATIELSGVENAQTVRLELWEKKAGREASGPTEVRVTVLAGDVNGDGEVDSADARAARSSVDEKVTADNFRSDFDIDGTITAADIVNIRGASR